MHVAVFHMMRYVLHAPFCETKSELWYVCKMRDYYFWYNVQQLLTSFSFFISKQKYLIKTEFNESNFIFLVLVLILLRGSGDAKIDILEPNLNTDIPLLNQL